MSDRLEKDAKIRCTEQEKAAWHAAAARRGLKFSQWARMLIYCELEREKREGV